MPPTTLAELREAFLRFFESKDHLRLPSSSLVPEGDPTLLFTTAGMVQMKPYFVGQADPPHPRLTSVQKCFRTTDIDEVGDASHLTFLEMLGNFSVGDYFKEGAIDYAYEFVTEVLELDPERIYVTIFDDGRGWRDEEAERLWRAKGLPPERIYGYGRADNWWGPPGRTGPCGPCSELHYDFGPQRGCGTAECHPNHGCGRFLEIWNLVFMEFEMDEAGEVEPLPARNVDTGMGLERVGVVMQDAAGIYETDLFQPLVAEAERLTGRRYGEDPGADRSMRIMVEHSRAVTFLLADGVLPSNEGRGYVLRRVLRRAVRHGHLLGVEEVFLPRTTAAVVEVMAGAYPYLHQRWQETKGIVEAEEVRFRETLHTGLARLEEVLAGLEGRTIPGQEAFRLYDTYGFPLELTREVAQERGLEVDERGFQAALEAQRQRGRASGVFAGRKAQEALAALAHKLPPTTFTGYQGTQGEGRILAMLAGHEPVERVREGQEMAVILDRTPFYAEAGGQVGDTGRLTTTSGVIRVEDTQRAVAGREATVHYGVVEQGYVEEGQLATAIVDGERRWRIMAHHTATHLLHRALQEVLGSHAKQAGSLVAPDRLRFDFFHNAPLSRQELARIHDEMAGRIRANLPVRADYLPYQKAIEEGAMALFGEKYGDTVRVVSIDGYSKELCGGTHMPSTGAIGEVVITAERSAAAGVRRIEALAGRAVAERRRERVGELVERVDGLARALEGLARRGAAVDAARAEVEVLRRELEEGLESERVLRERLDGWQERLEGLGDRTLPALERAVQDRERQRARQLTTEELLSQVQTVDGIPFIAAQVEIESAETMRQMTDWLREKLGSGVVVLGSAATGRPSLVAAVTPDLVERGYDAGRIIRQVAAHVGGSGGGKPTLAQAGGQDAERLPEALAQVAAILKQRPE